MIQFDCITVQFNSLLPDLQAYLRYNLWNYSTIQVGVDQE